MRKLYLLLIAILFASFSFSQTSLKGRIIDSNGFPLPGATIILNGDKGAVSDFNGFYKFIDVEAGDTEISVSYIGFEDTNISVALSENTGHDSNNDSIRVPCRFLWELNATNHNICAPLRRAHAVVFIIEM